MDKVTQNNNKKGKEKEKAQEPVPSPIRWMHDINVVVSNRDSAALIKVLQDKTARKRVVSRIWPRDPNGGHIRPDNSQPGKMTSNGVQLWGATLYDFYHVRRIPMLENVVTIATGSKLAAWMRVHGELKHGAQEIAWAAAEEAPRQVPPPSVAGLIGSAEDRVRRGIWGKSMPLVDKVEEEGLGAGKKKEFISLFDTSAYPAPWPLIPFSYSVPRVQDYIPLRRLPKKLIVHDPWNQLSVSEYDYEPTGNADWTKKPDVTHIYTLKLSLDAAKRLEAEKRQAPEQEKKGLHFGFLIRPNDNEPGPIEPPIFVVYPPTPPEESIEEAHLYISPAHTAGRGNHSVVYYAEWEVPRSMLMRPSLCTSCVIEDVKKILAEEDGSRIDPQWKMRSATLKKVQHANYPFTVKVVEDNQNDVPRVENDDDKDLYTLVEGETYNITEFEGPVRKIHTRVPWYTPGASDSTGCPHQNQSPPTAKILVIAKLSLEHDRHLANEARNYQKFPKHMFEHWNGFNIMAPLLDPTPVGAVVPQFYGYYVPEPEGDSGINKHDGTAGRYLSPILLLEDCGVPLYPEDLSIDDKNECCSLYYRFHHAGWVHGSVAPRNILIQRGPSLYRDCASKDREFSFRLIDFGRSFEIGNHEMIMKRERREVSELFEDPVRTTLKSC